MIYKYQSISISFNPGGNFYFECDFITIAYMYYLFYLTLSLVTPSLFFIDSSCYVKSLP